MAFPKTAGYYTCRLLHVDLDWIGEFFSWIYYAEGGILERVWLRVSKYPLSKLN